MKRAKQLVRRVLLFLAFFSIAPCIVSVVSSLLFRGGGIRGSSTTALGVLAWRADQTFVLAQIGQIVLCSVGVSFLLALASFLAWKEPQGHSVLRAGRLALLVWLIAATMYPAISGWVPILRAAPWTLSVFLLALCVSVAFAWPGARPGVREGLFAVAILVALFFTPRISTGNLERLAKRSFTANDVLIIGFDSVSQADTIDLLERFQPRRGGKTVFTNAQTPWPSTSVAWRSVFSGQYPPDKAELPSVRWGSGTDGWLPSELRARGFDVMIAQDMPSSNWYTETEGVRVMGLQGWKASLQSFLWKAGFPLSSVGAAWWVAAFGGPSKSYGRPAHCASCFVADSLQEVARAAAKGPVLGAIHTCLLHGPNQLTLSEAVGVPGWWRLPGAFFLGAGEWASDARSQAVRMRTLRSALWSTLELLDREGIIGHATVFVIADHGPRGEGVPSSRTDNVMLALFRADGTYSKTVTTPVSLVDIAPTIRQSLSLPEARTDGQLLPRDDDQGEARRTVKTKVASTQSILGSMGYERKLDANELSKLGVLLKDGSFDYNSEIVTKAKAFAAP